MFPWSVQHFFAGAWPLVWHWGVPAGIIILCVAAEVVIGWLSASVPFVQNFLKPLQNYILFLAIAAAAYLYAFSDGVKIEHARGVAQQQIIIKQVDSVVDDVMKAPVPPEPKKGESHAPLDRWNCTDC